MKNHRHPSCEAEGSTDKSPEVLKEIIAILEDGAKLADAIGKLDRAYDESQQKAAQAKIQIDQVNAQIAGAQVALQISPNKTRPTARSRSITSRGRSIS